MKAAVLYDYNTPLVIEELDLDGPKRGEVLVRTGAAGICRSDYHFMKGEAKTVLPTVMGHEGAGIVEEVGEGVTKLKPGDHVILSFVPNCGLCHFCTTGRPNLCDLHAATPNTMFDGTTRLRKGDRPITHFGKVGLLRRAHRRAGDGMHSGAEDGAHGPGRPHRLLRNHRSRGSHAQRPG